MSVPDSKSAQRQALAAKYQNPYALLELEDDLEVPSVEPTLEQKQAYFHNLQNPPAYHDIFGDPDEKPSPPDVPKRPAHIGQAEKISADSAIPRELLEQLFDEVFGPYKPHIARPEWARVMDFRSEFLDKANRSPTIARRVVERLQLLRISLMPGEKIAAYRAPADRLLDELRRILA
jgi:hypothetical protein